MATQMSATIVKAESLGKDICAQMIDILQKHNALIRSLLGETSMSGIKYALRIRAQLIRCEIFALTISNESLSVEREDFRWLIRSLKQLARLISCLCTVEVF